MAISLTVYEIFSVKVYRDLKNGLGVVQGHWKWRRSIDHIRLTIGPPLYILLYLVPFLSYLMLSDTMTLKFGLKITQSHSNRYHS